jgi:N6-L-threonylcarbamoyladenine synthase
MLLKANSLTDWHIIGETRDDAVGECYDKVARMLSLPYPGGPEIEARAKENRLEIIPFPRPMLHQHNFDFSFSGLKTAVLYYIKEHGEPDEAQKAQIADSFQKAAFAVLTEKTLDACASIGAKSCIIAGGVSSNQSLRNHLALELGKAGIALLASKNALNTDNAAMIAVAAYFSDLQKQELPLVADGNLGV